MTRTSIGEYKVTRRLEDADELYLVRSPRGTRCHLRLLDTPNDPEAWEQARKEAALCASLDHPAVGRLLDAFEDDGRLALVVEAVDGEGLDKLLVKLRAASLSLHTEAVWYLAHQLAGALAQAHTTGDDDVVAVCHGHLSPRAVTIAWNGFVRLDGLGLAPLVTAGSILTEAVFRAPEEAGGSRATPRGDCYGLAMLTCTLLTGEPPTGDTSVDALGLPQSLREPLASALETAVSKRRVTSLELEHALSEVVKPAGRNALADAMTVLKRGSASAPGARHSASSPGARNLGPRRVPIRSKQATLLGNLPPPRAKMPSKPPNIDWDAATEAARRPSIPPGELDDFSWGDDPNAQPPAAAGQSAREVAGAMASADSAAGALDHVEDLRDAFPGAVTSAPGRAASAPETAASAPAARPPLTSSSQPGSAPRAVPRPTPSGKGLRRPAESDAEIEVDGGSDFLDYDDEEDLERPERHARFGETPTAPAPVATAPIATAPMAAAPMAATPAPLYPTVPMDALTPMGPPAVPAALPVALGAPPPVSPPPHAPVVPASQPLPADGSPWSSRDVEPTASSALAAPRLSLSMAVLITLATSVVVLAIGVWWVRRDNTIVLPTVPSQSAPVASSAPPPKPRVRRPVAPAKASADTRTGADLPPDKGYLIVRFPKNDGNVFFFTTPHGPVNQKIAVPCGTAFVRVGKSEKIGVKWLSPGKPAIVACQKVTEVKIEP